MLFALIVALLGGLVIGSFLNVVVYRLPRGTMLENSRSLCPHCEHPVRARDNIPVVSWLVLRGRCRDCGEPISRRYPLVEAGTALAYMLVVAVHYDDTTMLALGIALVTFLIPLALIDLDTRMLPNKLTGPAAVTAIVLGLLLDPSGEPERLIAGLAAAGFFLLAALAYPQGMGMGDVKLAGVLGLYLGRAVAAALLIGLLLGVLVGVAIMARKGVAAGRKTKVPFGPFLAIGGFVALFVGDTIVDAYADTF